MILIDRKQIVPAVRNDPLADGSLRQECIARDDAARNGQRCLQRLRSGEFLPLAWRRYLP